MVMREVRSLLVEGRSSWELSAWATRPGPFTKYYAK